MHFDDFTADYYLSRDEQGTSHLQVSETITAVFPASDQNHGITRNIPYTNQGGSNITVTNGQALNFTAARNNQPEPYNLTNTNQHFSLAIGNPNVYLHGNQTYNLNYEFANVITAFDSNNQLTYQPNNEHHQELYWDTNGTGWDYAFQALTARVHFTDPITQANYLGQAWCYVGTANSNNQSRCTITPTADGVKFTTTNLAPGENLTFDLEFAPQTFVVPEPPINYTPIALGIVTSIGLITLTTLIIRARNKLRDKIHLYKQSFTPVQYTPLPNISVSEMAELSMRPIRSPRVAALIDLAVNHHIELIKGDAKLFGKHNWQIKVKDQSKLSPIQLKILQVINRGKPIVADELIDVTNQTYNSTLTALDHSITQGTKSTLRSKQLLELENKSRPNDHKSTCAPLIVFCITWFTLVFISTFVILSFADNASPRYLPSTENLIPISIVTNIIILIASLIAWSSLNKYDSRTEQGLKTALYLDGLREYIKLAETDRLKVLQSVNGADTSHQGIVNLYEKLLPYAILFGLEDSWMRELNRYYELDEVNTPSWFYGGAFYASDLHNFSRSVNASMPSGSSSSSSGSGGGGFSGGGGGGGGGGAW